MAASLRPNQPNLQPFHFFDTTADPPRWRPSTPEHIRQQPASAANIDRIHLVSWNIDFSTPASSERMTTALQYLRDLQSEHDQKNGPPTVIFFQEMVASDLHLIQQAPWVREKFYVTDLSGSRWRGSYGTSTLVDRRLALQRAFRVPYALSTMQRDGLFVDIKVHNSIIRLCNTHLESLASGTTRRPVQMKLASEFMHGTNDTSGDDVPLPAPHAAILAGDLNAFAPEDADSPRACNLQDAFLALGGREGTADGFTWGYQNPSWMADKFPCGRLDKVLFCGAIEVLLLTKIGEGLKARIDVSMSDDEGDSDSDRFEELWVTDHFGLMADFRILSSSPN
ncbi:Endonuclease/exonuclease/phosphatase [Aspergillus aurantiobrunneus]